jgi:biopolymer transport protein ExbB
LNLFEFTAKKSHFGRPIRVQKKFEFHLIKEIVMETKINVWIRTWALALGLVFASVASISTNAFAQSAAPAAATAPASAVPQTAQVAPPKAKAPAAADNPYGMAAVWQSSDSVAKGVLLILVIMSMGSWYILAVKALEQRKVARYGLEAAEKFWRAGTVAQGAAALTQDSPYQFIAASGLEATQKHDGLMGHIPLADWISMSMQRAVDRVNREMQSGLSFLATVGSVSPFVGLFGTVWGIYHALSAIGISGQASIDKVAGPVGEALIMTAIGLAVAVPAVLGYNWLVNRNKGVMEDVRSFGNDLNAVLQASTSAKS